MKNYRFKGVFISAEGHKYELEVRCMSFFQAFFLLTADAIRSGKHYQLNSIEDEKGNIRYVDDIMKCGGLLTQHFNCLQQPNKNNELISADKVN